MAGHLRLRVALVLLALAATNPLTLATERHEAPKPRIYATLGEALAAVRDIGAEAPRAGLPFQNETMVQEAYLKPSNTAANHRFGHAVAVSGDIAVVGTPFEGGSSGAAYVFLRSADGWSPDAYLKAWDTPFAIQFGNAVGISGDTIVVGAPNHGPGGAAYVFVRSGTSWTQQKLLTASNVAAWDAFGASVAVSGDTIVVGAYAEDSNATGINGDQADNSALESGAAYVFVRSGSTWSQQAYLKASNTDQNDNFGWSVGVSGDTAVVGAFREASNSTGVDGDQGNDSATQAGAAYVFGRSGTTWTQQAYLKASNTRNGDVFGYSVAASGDTVVVGAPIQSAGGAAYVFVRGAASWFQQAYLTASNAQVNDQFGRAVAISGNLIVSGAIEEDSAASGVNGDEADNSLTGAGAAYVFVRSGGTWSQHTYLKASNPGFDDSFGQAVAVSTDTVIVGAFNESSSATGVNGNQADDSAFHAGAAYVFRFPNTDPTITGGSITRWPSTFSNFAIATVGDAQDNPGSLDIEILSANPSNGVTLSTIVNTAGAVTADVSVAPGASDATFVLRVTDSFGASAQASFDVIVIPAVTITPVISPAANVNGWHNNGPVTVSWTVANSTTQSGCNTTVLSSQTTVGGTTLTCTAANAGGSLSDSATIRIDTTAPTGSAARTPASNVNGWNNTDVLVTFTCADDLSGAASAGASYTVSTDGPNQSRAFPCEDLAGNTLPLSITGISIDKTPPTVTAASVVAAPNPATVNVAVSLTASLTDTGPSNLSRAEFRIDTSPYALLASASGASAAVTGSLGSFSTPDVVETCVRAVDLAGNRSVEECTYIAVFDPSAGHVTGAGTIDSPPGALVGSTATGAARFGFQSKYARGAYVPTGSTSFKFRAGGLEFDSTSYVWLVVSGARAQYKGSGMIRNQAGTFDFILTVIDGDEPGGGGIDKFRIKITGSSGVVYDNQMGAADGADPSTAIAGGHIVIRK